MKESEKPKYIMGVGASAGGLEAIENLFSAVRPDTGMAFVVIQHLSPDYKSLMVEILSKKTDMAVLRAENGMEVLANHIYLITPGNNLTIFHGKLLLHKKEPSKSINLPIDIFLKSLAEDQADRAGAIILSGTGSDGMRGIRSIKEAGGFVLVQSEESAQFDGMPRSAISTGLADFIAPPEEMADLLLKLTDNAIIEDEDYKNRILTDEDSIIRIFAMIRDRHKIDFTFYKMSTIIRRINRRMTVNAIKEVFEYVRFMENSSREVTALYKELLIGVTSFYRDKEAFQLLEEKYLPNLLQRVAGQDIRLWVAGCSTGEEAYTLAIVCKECLTNLGLNTNVKIFATDVDEDALSKAGGGVYPESIAADLSPRILSRYFVRNGDNFQVSRSIREMIVFAKHDVTKDPPFTNVELITCRNLLIYLQPPLQQKIFDYFNFSLNAQGILFLGSSESLGDMIDYFEPLEHKWKLYYSKGRKKQLHNANIMDPSLLVRRTQKAYSHIPGSRMKDYEVERVLERFLTVMHEGYIPLSIIVNEQLEIVHVVGDTNKYFRVPTGKFEPSITSMAHKELSIPLSTGLQKAFQTKESISYSNIIFRINDEKVNITLQIVPLPEKRGQESYVAVLIKENKQPSSDATENVSKNFDIAAETEQRIYDLEQELQFNRENLQATIEELETSNEELQATNEELLASNEELQSTNEELQSVNEEMHTVNAEYQLKITQLNEMNNDMDNLLTSTQIATIFLDENLEIRKFTPSVENILHINRNDLERPISAVAHILEDVDLLSIIAKVQKNEQPIEIEIKTRNDKHYLMKVLPYVITPEVNAGIVLTFTEVTKLRAVQESLASSERQHKIAASLTIIGYWEIDMETLQTTWTDEVYTIHDLPPGSSHDVKNGIEFYHPEDRPIIQKAVQDCMENGTAFDLELRFITAANNAKWVRSIARAKIDAGKVVSVYGAFQDITERKLMEEELKKSEYKYRMLFENMNASFALHEMIYDENGEPVDYRFLEVNPMFEKETGLKAEATIGHTAKELLPNTEQYWIDTFDQATKTGESISYQNYSRELDQWYDTFVFSPQKGQFAVFFINVSERVLAQKELQEKIRNANKEKSNGKR
jgi:two-component system, chemotaxis family, CheB/CheR fusion protein